MRNTEEKMMAYIKNLIFIKTSKSQKQWNQERSVNDQGLETVQKEIVIPIVMLTKWTKKPKKARVCIIFFRTILCQYLSNFYFSNNLDGDGIDFKNYTFQGQFKL